MSTLIQKTRKPTCREYREEAARLGVSVWKLRESDRESAHRVLRATLGKNWKPIPRNDLGFLIRRELVNGQWREHLEYPGKKAVEKTIREKSERSTEQIPTPSTEKSRKTNKPKKR